MKETFIFNKKFTAEASDLIEKCETVINNLQADRLDPTLRQIYYKLVKSNFIENKDSIYKKLSGLMRDARLAGLIDWDGIVDIDRPVEGWGFSRSAKDALWKTRVRFRLDKWKTQPYYFEVWVEKRAALNVVERACQPWYIQHAAMKGYPSITFLKDAADRIIEKISGEGKIVRILYLGDHDPTGVHIDKKMDETLRILTNDAPFELVRIGLNMDQIQELNLPPNPAKLSDTRAKKYVDQFGYESWELDALELSDVEELVRDQVEYYLDQDEWDKEVEKENEIKNRMKALEDSFED